MNQYNTDKLKKGLDELGISYSDQQIEQLLTYYEMMIEKNKVMNLTSITEFDEAVEKHFLDSLSLVRVVSLHSNWKILDLGTGAGFPGIPLKIFFSGTEYDIDGLTQQACPFSERSNRNTWIEKY